MKSAINLTKTKIFGLLIISTFFVACEPNDHDHNEQELITTVRITATPQPSGTPLVFQFSDPDGDGGDAPIIDTIMLASSTTYDVSLEILNESVNPADTITNEIEEEATAHQFFFETTGVDINTVYNDLDSNGDPIGLLSVWTAGSISSGTFRLTLKHLDGIPKDNNINTGDTDIQIDFPAIVQ